MESKNFVRMSNQWFEGKHSLALQYGERGLVLLAKMMQQQNIRGYYSFTDRHIQEWFGYTEQSYRSIKSVFDILDMFKHNGIVKFYKDYNFTKICTDVIKFIPTSISLPDKEYFILFDHEIDIILNSSQHHNKPKLLLLFGCLKYHYNTDTRFCYPTIKTLSEKTGLSEATILSYIDALVDLDLILYDNLGTALYSDGNVKECRNYYTMNYPGNKEILEQVITQVKQELQQQSKNKQLKLINSVIGNKKRSIKTKLRHLTDKYSKGLISDQDYLFQRDALQADYEELVSQQKIIHNQ